MFSHSSLSGARGWLGDKQSDLTEDFKVFKKIRLGRRWQLYQGCRRFVRGKGLIGWSDITFVTTVVEYVYVTKEEIGRLAEEIIPVK